MTDSFRATDTGDAASGALDDAMDWLLRLQSAGDDPQILSEFERWLARSAANRDAWKQARRSWDALGRVPPVHTARWASRRRKRPARRGARRRRMAVAGAAAALAACLVLFLQPRLHIWMKADYVSAVGETRRIVLEDGSRVLLNTDSAISVGHEGGGRSVALLKGEAFFEVRPDPAAPFTVEAADMAVTVVGTAFDVRITDDGGTVGVSEGEVHVHVPGNADAGTARLRRGDFLTYDHAAGTTRVRALPTDRYAGWHDGRLFLKDVTVGDAVEDLRRYYRGLILLPDSALAKRKVTGLYDVRDPERALKALATPHGGVLRNPLPGVLLLTGR